MSPGKNTKVLLVVPPSPYETPLFLQHPICLLYTATVLKDRGYNVSILDMRLREAPSIEATIADMGAPCIAIVTTSTYDLTQCYTWDLNTARQTVDQLRRYCSNVFIVGVHGTLHPKMTLGEVKADGILAGEVEQVVPWFLEHFRGISGGEEFFEAPGTLDLASLPVPDFSMLPVTRYTSYIPTSLHSLQCMSSGILLSNRGCPYTCSYCYTGFFGGTKLRLRPAELVIEEMRQLDQIGIENIFFLDYTFTANRKWLDTFLTARAAADLSVGWGCQTRANLVDPETLSRMAHAGCRYIWYGFESPHISDLNQSKPISQEKMEDAVRWTNQAGIVPMAFLLVGLPGENVESMISWASSQPFIFSVEPVTPRYGTKLFEQTQIPVSSLSSWQDMPIAATLLQSDQESVDYAYRKLMGLPNYFENVIESTKMALRIHPSAP